MRLQLVEWMPECKAFHLELKHFWVWVVLADLADSQKLHLEWASVWVPECKDFQRKMNHSWVWRVSADLAYFRRPFAHFLAPFGSLSAPFGSPLAPFWLHLDRFWSLGLTFAHPCAPFSHFGDLMASFFIFFVFSIEIVCKILFSEIVHWKADCWSRKSHIAKECRTYLHRKQIILCNPPLQGPERNTLPLAT